MKRLNICGITISLNSISVRFRPDSRFVRHSRESGNPFIFVISGFGRIAESVVDRQQVPFFCLSKRKVPKKKTPGDLLEFPIPIPSH